MSEETFLFEERKGKVPFLPRFRAARTRPILMNGGILKSQKLFAELTIKITHVKSANKNLKLPRECYFLCSNSI